MGNKGWYNAVWPSLLLVILLLVVWQLSVDGGLVPEWQLPSPTTIVYEMFKVWPRLMDNASATINLALIGYGGGAFAGFMLAAVLHLIPIVRKAVYPLLVVSQNVPVIAIGPILTIWLGYGVLPKVILVWIVCFFPVSVAMLNGFKDTDPTLRNYMQMIGAGNWQLFMRLELPNAVTHLFSGLKIAASYSVLSAVVAEWLGADKGLGHYMILSSKGYEPARVFAAVFLIVLLSLALFGLVAVIERFVIRWRPMKGAGRA
ncbi:ABC-type nitrate/sulfonate/bicarbonate transport system, permease component [Paenibacillus catalpae]|uniref:ABC-type nitrate/sulfonate/bicarbonate transport system, permease component n=1 Tax=Paenibacillus catalpae TaxID=1045775 RepID=A0A1I1U8C8_9BACL|nr:ABC transporter permease [Paenibacillus catalpae]SFD67121.1 ABC-type nitrate/sulfonate/bicarbonate transport system, permease component [Paenibacillus catalpae]